MSRTRRLVQELGDDAARERVDGVTFCVVELDQPRREPLELGGADVLGVVAHRGDERRRLQRGDAAGEPLDLLADDLADALGFDHAM